MNYKLLRSDYYNEDYLLNKQEEKEFHLPLKSPYYKVRAKAFLLTGEVLGTWDTFQHLISTFIFTSETNEPQIKLRKNKFELHQLYSQDLLQKKFTSSNSDQNLINNIDNNISKESSIINFPPIYEFIPEINQMSKLITYPEIYSAISNFADRQMLFINVFKENYENNLISGIIYFPYTPKDLLSLNDSIIFSLANFTKILQLTKEKFPDISNREFVDILRQKLYDIYYLCEDSRDLHGVIDCHSFIKIKPKNEDKNNSENITQIDQDKNNNINNINYLEENYITKKNLFPLELQPIFNKEYTPCNNLASFFCSNHMCKKCCEINTNIKFCPIHDDIVNYYRDKMKDLLTFEQITHQFDNSLILRIQVKNNISLCDLKNLFSKENIEWDKNVIFYNESLQRIQFIYLHFKTHEDAKNLYSKRSEIDNKLQITIQPLLEDIKNIIDRIPTEKLINSCLLAIPVSCIAKNDQKLPSKSERLKKFSEVIENTLKIDNSKYSVTHCVNILSSEMKSYNFFIITFTEKKYLDKFYLNQPYFGGVIIHKLIHPIFFPKLRNKTLSHQNLCINCSEPKNPKCFFELCSNCCNYKFTNPTNNYIKNILHQKLGQCPCNISKQQNIISPVPKFEDYIIQKFNSMPNCGEAFIQQYTLKRSINKLKLLNNIRNGDFSWFKPIYDTNVTRMMLDMNKEFTIIMDNPSYKREQPLKINDKMYKVFTYQIEKPIFNFYECFSTEECFDENGDYFIEYDFEKKDIEKNKELKNKFNNNILNLNFNNNVNNNNNINNQNMINSLNYYNYIEKPKVFIDISEDNMESIAPSHLYESNKKILLSKDTFKFHIAIYGLDDEKITNQELVEEIYQEIKGQNINLNKEDIQLIDEESLLNDYLNKKEKNNMNFNNVENFGRIALIKFRNDFDGLKLYCNRNYFSLPLIDGKKGKPNIILGQILIDYIKKNQI
jgi:hypothetical protein